MQKVFSVQKCTLFWLLAWIFLHTKKNNLKNKILNEGLHLIFYFPKLFFPICKKLQANSSCYLFFCKHFLTPNVWCPKMCKILDTEHSVSIIVNIFLHQTCSNQNRVHFCTLNTFCIQNLTFLRLEIYTPY